jgi:hypothetical protein
MANSDLMQCQLITDERILSLPSRSTQAPTFPNVGRHEAQLEVREKSGFVRGLQLGRFMLIPSFSHFNPRISLTIKVSSVCIWHA